ncbi:MAG: ArsR family transcriptional regulator [Burkholderiales bacterium]|nr:ArsR family transcriptional regulator [Burkholderiales bacterium]
MATSPSAAARDVAHFPGLSRIGALLADPGRAAMLWSLMDGSARPAGELTIIAGLSPSAASGHLAKLTEGGLLTLEVRGRHRYYRIATAEIAVAIEGLAHLAQASASARPKPVAARTVPLEIRYARTCYDHMAGELAVRVFDHLLERGWLVEEGGDVSATESGAAVLAQWGIDVGAQRARKRRFACTCLDWSERRSHLAGALGAALLDHWRTQRWVERTERPRALRITPVGREQFDALLAT